MVKIEVAELWVTSQTLVIKLLIWGEGNSWRQKRYVSVPLEDIPEEVITDLIGTYLDAKPEEDHQQTALF